MSSGAILLTGAGGQLGRLLTQRLTNVTALPHGALDIADPVAVRELVARVRPRLIVNAAAYNNVDAAEGEPARAMAVNRDGVLWLAEAARAWDAGFVHFSSDFVFDGEKGAPYVEADPTRPINRYGESKLAGEQALAGSGARHVILRTSWVFSEFPGNFVTRVLQLLGEREALDVVDDQLGTPTYAGTLADIVVQLIARAESGREIFGSGAGNVLHAANAGQATKFDLAARIFERARAMGARLRATAVRPIKTSQYPLPAHRPSDTRLATGLLGSRFGITPPDWRDALDAVLARCIAPAGKL